MCDWNNSDAVSQLLLVGFGAVIGAILSFLATEISAWRQRKIAKKEKGTDLTNEIVAETLKFMFKANDILNDLWADKALCEDMDQKFPQEKKYEQIMFKKFNDNLNKDFFSQLMFHSSQLKRLEDQTIWKEFDTLMNQQRKIIDIILKDGKLEQCKEDDKEYKIFKRKFVERCIKLTQV